MANWNWKSYFAIIINIVIGGSFIFSGIAKLPTLERFGWTIAETGWFGWTVSEWLARIIIGGELFIGILFICQLGLKRIARPLAVFTLVFFTFYLLFILSKYGNEANCGCYGEIVPFTTKESILKNILLLILVGTSFYFRFQWKNRFSSWAIGILFLLSVLIPFFILPPDSIYLQLNYPEKHEKFPSEIVRKFYPAIKDHHKYILAIVSPSCKYCKKAATRMRIMKERHPELPLFFAFGKGKEKLPAFFEETHATNIPFFNVDNKKDFMALNSQRNSVPSIKWIQDSICVKESNYYTLKEEDIIKWLKE